MERLITVRDIRERYGCSAPTAPNTLHRIENCFGIDSHDSGWNALIAGNTLLLFLLDPDQRDPVKQTIESAQRAQISAERSGNQQTDQNQHEKDNHLPPEKRTDLV